MQKVNMKFKKAADKLYEKLITGEGGFYKTKRIHPWLNNDGSINWFNFLTGGSWIRLGITIGIMALIIIGLFQWGTSLANYGNLIEKVGNNSMCKHLLDAGKDYTIIVSNLTFP